MIDNDGDAREDLTFQFRFTNRLGNGDQGAGARRRRGTSVGGAARRTSAPVSAQRLARCSTSPESYHAAGRARRPPQRRSVRRDARARTAAKSFRKPYDFVGTKTFGSAEAYEAYAAFLHLRHRDPGLRTPGRVFVGQRDEPSP